MTTPSFLPKALEQIENADALAQQTDHPMSLPKPAGLCVGFSFVSPTQAPPLHALVSCSMDRISPPHRTIRWFCHLRQNIIVPHRPAMQRPKPASTVAHSGKFNHDTSDRFVNGQQHVHSIDTNVLLLVQKDTSDSSVKSQQQFPPIDTNVALSVQSRQMQ